ncbi:LLM class flavin-dependent oxidoreductase [Bacillus benzoevorans]|uniref:Alkanesulfonate monooxygenase SsuD/methylene tetrahydromethanopterin reductase-like flavin-dependent oxidoreductase (Luciferase family) n=1 Tax=Bacillus benzoevorans TaxID=1456 RepID=A0A7X0LWD6_9BACI|nr:LLM class flavin-dependent oxidoreductase [Bacillus benzoevorans]MBB6446578.1 alkanesulfonate monooxygenase SsuD/methylene tetrahydromethanopterin reductase-like flavin-dependent oxidoreductase (luciferase family) [Bacillus benzoevorans]
MGSSLLRKDRFLLGTFCSNCSNGMAMTKVPERWVNSWENNLKLAKMLDEADVDFMLPVARWIGTPGEEIDFHGSVLETITWAAGLLASTKNINVISTIHTAVNHPVVLAKQLATMSQIGQGRVGLNIVAGWHRPEYEALGLTLPEDNGTRYAYAQEWFDVIKKLWQEEDYFDWNGEHFNLKRVKSDPRPTIDVPIINAAGSKEGREFATRNADFLFTPALDLKDSKKEIVELKNQALNMGREVDVLTFSHVICRPTEAEALEYMEYAAKTNADWTAVENVIKMQFENCYSFPHEVLATLRDRFALGHGGFPLVGTPEQVADGITALAEAGFKGTTLSFVDYNKEFPYFRDEVLPILEKRGLRKSDKSNMNVL